MGSWLQKLLMRYVGPSFFGRIATSIVASIVAILGHYGIIIPADVLAKFSDSTQQIIVIVLGVLVGGVIDLKLSKSEKPETPELVNK